VEGDPARNTHDFLPTQLAWFGQLPFCDDRQFGQQIGETNALEGDPVRNTHFLQTLLHW